MLRTVRGMFGTRVRRLALPCQWLLRRLPVLAHAVALTLALTVTVTGAGQEGYDYDPLSRLVRHTDPTGQLTDYAYDAAGNIISVTAAGASTPARAPKLQSVSPPTLRLGDKRTLTLAGEHLAIGILTASHPGMVLANLRQDQQQLQVDLWVGPTVPVGPQALVFRNALGTATIELRVSPPLPRLSIEPSPLALPPDDVPRSVTVRLSGPDDIAHQVSIGSSDPTRASVTPALLTLAPGQTSVQVQVRPRQAGFAELRLTSETLQPLSVPVFVTTDFRGVNTSHAAVVGIDVGEPPAQADRTIATGFHSHPVGVAIGAALTGITPRAVAAGSTQALSLTGFGLPAGLQVAVHPAEGLTVLAVEASPARAEVLLAAEASAAPGIRRLVVTDGSGVPLALADPALAELRITTGQPAIASVEPLFGMAGSTMELMVRGRHLQHGTLMLDPAIDLRVDSRPHISSDGTELRARIQIAPLAAGGARTVRIKTPSGQTDGTPASANQFTVVQEISHDVTPIVALPVGVAVGSPAEDIQTSTGTLASAAVGLSVGPAAVRVTPAVGVRGTRITLVVSGSGLEAVTGVSVAPSEGLHLDAPVVQEQGARLLIPLTIDPQAPLGPRRLGLTTAAGALPFVAPDGDQLLVAAPVPRLDSVAPQVLEAGQTVRLTLRGQRLAGSTGVRFDPPEGVLAVGPFVADQDGSVLNFEVRVAPDAPSGARTVMVDTPGGASIAAPQPGNTLHIARQRGPSYDAIAAVPVGVVVRTPPTAPQSTVREAYASAVGVVLSPPAVDLTESHTAFAPALGVVVGSAVRGMVPHSPDGLARGAAGVLTVSGWGLDTVSAALVSGPAGVSLGQLTAQADGTALQIPVQIADTAPSGTFGIRLFAPTGGLTTRLAAVHEVQLLFEVGGAVEVLDSVGPIVLEQGKTYTFSVRGIGLRDVFEVLAEPGAGLRFGAITARPVWSTDAFGEKLNAHLSVAPDAPLGSSVIRLRTPGAVTAGEPAPANTVTVVAPQ